MTLEPGFGEAHGRPCDRRPRTRCARRGCAAPGPRAAPPDRHRSSGSGSRPTTGRERSAGRGCARDSISPSPAAPARLAPSIVNVACQMRSTRCGVDGYSRSPPGSGRPAQASRSTWRCPASSVPRSALSRPNASNAERLPPGPTPTSRRPPDIRSSTAASSATRIGSSSGRVTIAVPRRIRDVCAATCARKTNGPGRPPSSSWKWCWATQAESKPKRSAWMICAVASR